MTSKLNFKDDFERRRCLALSDEIAKLMPLSYEVKQAFALTPREVFAPIAPYEIDALPLSAGQWISSPLTVAKMTEALMSKGGLVGDIKIKPADSVLEIGAGSGYQAALLTQLVRRVFALERIKTLYEEASLNFSKIGAKLTLRHADGLMGLKSYAPFDRILFSAQIESIPNKLFAQLNKGGILVAPIGSETSQKITRFIKDENADIVKEELGSCLFVPTLPGLVN